LWGGTPNKRKSLGGDKKKNAIPRPRLIPSKTKEPETFPRQDKGGVEHPGSIVGRKLKAT